MATKTVTREFYLLDIPLLTHMLDWCECILFIYNFMFCFMLMFETLFKVGLNALGIIPQSTLGSGTLGYRCVDQY